MIKNYFNLFFQNKKNFLISRKTFFKAHPPSSLIKSKRVKIMHIRELLNALSPERLLKRGFALVTDDQGNSIHSVKNIKKKDKLLVQILDGEILAEVNSINYNKTKI